VTRTAIRAAAGRDGDDGVALAPDDQAGDQRRQLETVVGADVLAADVDDGSDGVQERLTRACVLQRRPPAREHVH
jgi:hypothetical protein